LSPPNIWLAWAKAGVTNISLSFVLAVRGAVVDAPGGAATVDRATKSARTITGTGPIATLLCLENPADSALPHGDLAGPPGPR
jgi:hypothetical protein